MSSTKKTSACSTKNIKTFLKNIRMFSKNIHMFFPKPCGQREIIHKYVGTNHHEHA